MWVYLIVFLALLSNLNVVDSAACTTYTSQTTCEETNGCVWATSACACGSDVEMDIIIALDASGSIGSDDYDIELQWVYDILGSGLTDNSRVGFVQFATNSYTKLGLDNGYSISQLQSFVFSNSLSYTGGWTNTVQALKDSMTEFDASSSSKIAKVEILITDGNPNLGGSGDIDVCAQAPNMEARGITTVVIGVGSGYNPANIDCLVDDPSHMIEVSSYTNSQLQDVILPILSTVTCPVTYSLTVTEVEVEQDSGTGSRFVEVYNRGGSVPLDSIRLYGLFDGVLTTDSSLSFTQGQYLVMYDGSADLPNCYECDCVEDSTVSPEKWCQDAIYIECCDSGCDCSWDGTNNNMDATNWYIWLQDTNDLSDIDTVTYASSSWPSIRTGYTYELKETGYDNDIGSNWQESCSADGTPGSGPIDNCTWSCTTSQCTNNGNGAVNATCGTDSCICNDISYFASDASCLLVPDPSNCIAYIDKYMLVNNQDNDSYIEQNSVRFEWTAASLTTAHDYKISYIDGFKQDTSAYTSSRILVSTDFDYEDARNSATWGTIQTRVTANGLLSLSTAIPCTVVTLAPTPAPTGRPTEPPLPSPTSQPTKKPTFSQPYCYVGGEICLDDRCSCWGQDLSCTGPDIYKPFAASDDEQYVTIKMWPSDYTYYMNVTWSISYRGVVDEYGNDVNDSNSTNENDDEQRRRRRRMSDSGSIRPSQGFVEFPGDGYTNEMRIGLTIPVEVSDSSSNYRLYRLSIDDCETHEDYDCTETYPDELYMIVDITGGSAYNSSSKEKEMPEWVWWVIGALLIFGAILAWLIYRFWFKGKEAKHQLGETEDELDNAIIDNDRGLGGNLGTGDIEFNPMATGVPNTERAPDLVQSEMQKRKMEANRTKVHEPSEKFVQRQEIGQKQMRGGTAKRNKGNDLQQPLLG